jgi:hypothetical protein
MMQIQQNDANSAKRMQIQRNGCKLSEMDANSVKRMKIQRNECKSRETDPSDNFNSNIRGKDRASEPAISHTSQQGLQRIISSTLQLPGVVAAATRIFSAWLQPWWRARLQPWWRARLNRGGGSGYGGGLGRGGRHN